MARMAIIVQNNSRIDTHLLPFFQAINDTLSSNIQNECLIEKVVSVLQFLIKSALFCKSLKKFDSRQTGIVLTVLRIFFSFDWTSVDKR